MSKTEISGLWLVDKPIGPTSRQVVNIAAGHIGTNAVGHTGTLDPQASGLLILLSGSARKLQNLFSNHDKCYLATIELGYYSESDDGEGPFSRCQVKAIPSPQEIATALASFQGWITQIPPNYSAIKIKGQRAYTLARKGVSPKLAPRRVYIHAITLISYDYPTLIIEVKCSAGTYIRAMARDIGAQLATGGYIKSLRRVAIADFDISQAVPVDKLSQTMPISLERALNAYPRITLTAADWPKVQAGQLIATSQQFNQQPVFIWINDKIVALARTKPGFVSCKKLLAAI